MITEAQAREICRREINHAEPESLDIVVTDVLELPDAWVVHYQSRAFVESGNFSDRLAGNAPFVICKKTGKFVVLCTALPLERQIQEAVVSFRSK